MKTLILLGALGLGAKNAYPATAIDAQNRFLEILRPELHPALNIDCSYGGFHIRSDVVFGKWATEGGSIIYLRDGMREYPFPNAHVNFDTLFTSSQDSFMNVNDIPHIVFFTHDGENNEKSLEQITSEMVSWAKNYAFLGPLIARDSVVTKVESGGVRLFWPDISSLGIWGDTLQPYADRIYRSQTPDGFFLANGRIDSSKMITEIPCTETMCFDPNPQGETNFYMITVEDTLGHQINWHP